MAPLPTGAMARLGLAVLAVGALAVPLAAHAQAPPRLPEVAILCAGFCPAPPLEASIPTFLQTLAESGYVDGRKVRIESRASGVAPGALRHHAAELVRRRPSVILAWRTDEVRAAMSVTREIPIVMVAGSDAVAQGIVPSPRAAGWQTSSA